MKKFILLIGLLILFNCSQNHFSRKSDLSSDHDIQSNQNNLNLPPGYVLVRGGWFKMGDIDGNGNPDERPVHKVYVDDFIISQYEVYQKEYKNIMGENPSQFRGQYRPVESVSWYDAIRFCNEKSKKEGLNPCYTIIGDSVYCDFSANGYRLPTEAEWEYAARGGHLSKNFIYSGSNKISEVAWYAGNSGWKTKTCGLLYPNELGLYDMSGNVYEWCWDWYEKDYYKKSPKINPTGPESGELKVARGGSWFNELKEMRISARYTSPPNETYNNVGFRVVRRP